ncbi:(2Fe-2S) ferredoxin domain-containing protein [Alkalibacter saccharofermentans]|uniref:NADP-reducing hydrogenase subunit HndB n=1 Tax=Alkalibacter saccharofermentans DSM 14828 TaxID=1120975 RepID=A0A1M4SME2_9FIRM|nr:(2Fe-2S) ferredoxin domain-containing protein [Alkalibacter saccharofermentans]SHE33147.1 NADP-reducing hydrogenase subunit HndB [Alkalibacter saccharofermentans DSM 14828]
MNKVKSLDELMKIRKEAEKTFNLRATSGDKDRIILRVGMATCGIASGARETMNTLIEELAKEDITNVSVTQTGCMGYCEEEPIVEVVFPDKPSVVYAHVDQDRAKEIVQKHIKEGVLLENAIMNKSFDTVRE